GKPAAAQLAGLWSDLDSADAARAHRALARLMAAPAEAVALFRRELKPVAGKGLTEREVERLIADLCDDSFEVREKATRTLARAGWPHRSALLAALKASSDVEKTSRLQKLLDVLTPL